MAIHIKENNKITKIQTNQTWKLIKAKREIKKEKNCINKQLSQVNLRRIKNIAKTGYIEKETNSQATCIGNYEETSNKIRNTKRNRTKWKWRKQKFDSLRFK